MRVLQFGIILALLVQSCKKENVDPLVPAPFAPAEQCGSDGARLEATFDGSAWCPNANLLISPSAGEITINGITILGSTLTLQLDSLAPGTYEMMQEANALLYTNSMGIAYMSQDIDPVTLVITEHDTLGLRIKGSFNGEIYTVLGTDPKPITGSFDMTYTEE